MSKYMVNRQRNTCCVGILSAKPSRACGRTRLLLLEMELKMVSWTRGGNIEDMLSYGMITWLMSLEGQEN